jgi:hypothetical protein
MWLDEYEKDERVRRQFAECANLLLTRGFLCEMEWNRKLGMNDYSRLFRFAYLHQELFRGFFQMIGWEFVVDAGNHVIHLVNPADTGRVRLSDLQTRVVFCLYLIYEEKRQQLGEGEYVGTYSRDVARRLQEEAGVAKVPMSRLSEAFQILSRYGLLERVEGNWPDPDCRLQIPPSILHMVSAETVRALHGQLVDSEEAEDE